MTAASTVALDTLRRMAHGHAGASYGEAAAWEILGSGPWCNCCWTSLRAAPA